MIHFSDKPVEIDADDEGVKSDEANSRTGRKIETEVAQENAEEKTEVTAEDAEGRFFLKNKLCILGLGDVSPSYHSFISLVNFICLFGQCSSKKSSSHHHGSGYNHGNIQYVQPVKVVPHGPPVPAVPVNSGYGAPKPSYNAPSSGYGAPKPSYNAPSSGYGAPKPSYNAPSSGYGAPKPSYNAPSSGYGAPKPSYKAPSSGYGAPKPSYNAPKPSYNAPSSGYGAPKPSYNAPSSGYGAPKPSYNAPSSSYGRPSYNGPVDSYGAPIGSISKYDTSSTQRHVHVHAFQTNFGETGIKREVSSGGHHNTFIGTDDTRTQHAFGGHGGNLDLTSGTFTSQPHNNHHQSHHDHQSQSNRQGRRHDECYCVPVSQCPSDSIMNKNGAKFQDYSKLIDPRILPNKDIVASADDDLLDLASASVEQNRAR